MWPLEILKGLECRWDSEGLMLPFSLAEMSSNVRFLEESSVFLRMSMETQLTE